MGVLVDWQIRERVRGLGPAHQRLVIRPFSDYGECPPDVISYGLSSAGYDLRVGTKFLIFSYGYMTGDNYVVDPKNFNKELFLEKNVQEHETIIIPPNCFALADTLEYIEMPRDLLAEVRGKSRLARTGYVMASTPIEPSWRGYITLEIGNLSSLPMKVYAGEGIGQLVFSTLDAKPEKDYDQKPNRRFQQQLGITGPEGTGN